MEQASSNGTLRQSMRLGPARSSFERLSCGGDSVSVVQVDRSELELTNG